MLYCYEHPRPSVATDIIICTKQSPYKVLLIKRKNRPFQDMWALSGGFMDMNENLIETAKRELYEETGIVLNDLTFFGIYDQPDRDPRGRTIGIVYYAFVNENITFKAGDDAKFAQWHYINELPELAFDHNKILNDFQEKILTYI